MNIDLRPYEINLRADTDFIHLTVNRKDGKEIQGWDTLQAIKNQILGDDVIAVEMYPKQDEVVNYANCRHLWVFKQNVKLPSTL